ncbi:MAG: AzlC family ABC transporter permease [Halosimplex sp.]
MSFNTEFRSGARAIAPLLPPAATVSLAVGVAAPAAGLTPAQTLGMSVTVYFPSVMLTALGLLASRAPDAVVVLTSLVVGLRVVILSLSIAPYFDRFPTRWKWLLAYFLWTPVYALTVERFAPDPEADARGFYLGMAAPLWVTVQVAVVAGVFFSARVPAGLELEFIVPLAFVALLRNFVTTRAAKTAALAGGALAIAGAAVPYGLGVVVATVGGTVAGSAVSRWEGGRTR